MLPIYSNLPQGKVGFNLTLFRSRRHKDDAVTIVDIFGTKNNTGKVIKTENPEK